MPTYTDHSPDPATGGVFLHRDDGVKELHDPSQPAVFLEQARIDADKARLAKDDARLASNDPVPPEVPGFQYDGLASPDPRQGTFARAQNADNVSRPDVAPSLAPDPVDALPPVAAARPPVAASTPAPIAQTQGAAPVTGPVAPENISFGNTNSPGAAPSPGAGGDTQLADLSRALTLEALRQRPGGSALVKGGKFQTAENQVTRGQVDPELVREASLDSRLAAQATGDRKQSENDAESTLIRDQQTYAGGADSAAQERHETGVRQLEDIQGRSNALADQIADSKVDQGRFWGSKSTANKIGTGIALALGALGAGISSAASGHPVTSQANDIFRAQIDEDINEQKQEIARKGEKLSSLGQFYKNAKDQLGDADAAHAATRAAALQGIAQQAKAMALASGSPQAIANADEIAAHANAASSQFALDWAAKNAEGQQTSKQFAVTQDHRVGGGGLSLAQKIKLVHDQGNYEANVGKSAAETAAQGAKNGGPNGQVVRYGDTDFVLPGLDKEEASKVRSQIADRNELVSTLGHLNRLYADTPTGSTIDTAEIKSVKQKLISQVNNAVGAGAASKEEAEQWNSALGGVRGAAGVNALTEDVHSGTKAKLNTYRAQPLR